MHEYLDHKFCILLIYTFKHFDKQELTTVLCKTITIVTLDEVT